MTVDIRPALALVIAHYKSSAVDGTGTAITGRLEAVAPLASLVRVASGFHL